MRRRELVLGAMAGAAGAALAQPRQAMALPVPPTGALGFRILRNGVPVGEQHLTFSQSGDQLRVDNHAELVVRELGIPVFHYAAMATEQWAGGVFRGVDSQVDHNGTQLRVHAAPIAGGFAIESTKTGDYDYTGQPGLMPLTYWNKAMLDAMILNVETGRHYPAIVSSPGWNYLPTADGGRLLAQRFDVSGKLHLSLWYDQNEQWAGLAFNILGQITYQKFTA